MQLHYNNSKEVGMAYQRISDLNKPSTPPHISQKKENIEYGYPMTFIACPRCGLDLAFSNSYPNVSYKCLKCDWQYIPYDHLKSNHTNNGSGDVNQSSLISKIVKN